MPDRQATTTSVRKQFTDGEITRSKKLEGAWGDRHRFYFDASFAAPAPATDLSPNASPHDGQIWHYDYAEETLTLKAYFPYNPLLHKETPNWETSLGQSLDLGFDGPDNLHISPYGTLVIAEDGSTANHLISWSEKLGAQAIVSQPHRARAERGRRQRLCRIRLGRTSHRTESCCSRTFNSRVTRS